MTQNHQCKNLTCTWRSLLKHSSAYVLPAADPGLMADISNPSKNSFHADLKEVRHLSQCQALDNNFRSVKFGLLDWNDVAFIVNNIHPLHCACYVPSILWVLSFRIPHFISILTAITLASISHPDYFSHLLTNQIASFCTKRTTWNTSMVSKASRIWTLPNLYTYHSPEVQSWIHSWIGKSESSAFLVHYEGMKP